MINLRVVMDDKERGNVNERITEKILTLSSSLLYKFDGINNDHNKWEKLLI